MHISTTFYFKTLKKLNIFPKGVESATVAQDDCTSVILAKTSSNEASNTVGYAELPQKKFKLHMYCISFPNIIGICTISVGTRLT